MPGIVYRCWFWRWPFFKRAREREQPRPPRIRAPLQLRCSMNEKATSKKSNVFQKPSWFTSTQKKGEALTCDTSFYSLANSPKLTHSRLNPDSLATTHLPEVCSRAGFAHPPDSLASEGGFWSDDTRVAIILLATSPDSLRRFAGQSLSYLGGVWGGA